MRKAVKEVNTFVLIFPHPELIHGQKGVLRKVLGFFMLIFWYLGRKCACANSYAFRMSAPPPTPKPLPLLSEEYLVFG